MEWRLISCFLSAHSVGQVGLVNQSFALITNFSRKVAPVLSGSVEFRSEKKSKISQPIGGFDPPENTNLVEDVVFFLPFKFRQILYSSFRGEVENVSANQR